MKKAILIPVLAGIIGFILITQRDSDMGSAGETGPADKADFPTEQVQENRIDESRANTDPAREIPSAELSAPSGPQTDEFRKLVSEIMKKNEFTPEERDKFHDMLSLVSPPSR